jgi:type IV pilus assembly protein PilE
MKKQMGFSMIELMITLMIVGILGAVAYPSYTSYLEEGKVQEATAALAEGRIRFSQYFQDHGSYVDAEATICPHSTQYFDVDCGAPDATTYTLTADGKNGMDGFSFSVTQANVRHSSSTKWETDGDCWIMRRGGSC